MTTTHSHHDNVEKQFGSQASAYLTSAVHASGSDLVRLGERLSAFPQATVLDLGCGAGHASFTAAQHVAQVTAYDLSSQMLEVVAEAAKPKGSTMSIRARAMPNPYLSKRRRLTLLSAVTPRTTGMMSVRHYGRSNAC